MGGEASVKEEKGMKEILDLYTRGFGQLINWEKRLIFFKKNLEDKQRKIVQILGCGVGKLTFTYRGLPLGAKLLDSFWNGIIDRFSKKFVGWKGASLSQADKCLLVKSTL